VELGAERIVKCDDNVVDCRLGIFVKLLINTNGIWELDGREGRKMCSYCIRDVWNIAGLALEDL
jgi:hypothetical protein